jgi:hypothetical protein
VSENTLIRRLAYREYLPLAGSVATWMLLLWGYGISKTTEIAAAAILIASVRALSEVHVAPSVRRRRTTRPEVLQPSRSLARKGVALAIALAAGLLALLILALGAIDQKGAAVAALLIGTGLPARHIGTADRIYFGQTAPFRIALAWSGAGLIAGALLAGLDWRWCALALGLREWAALPPTFRAGKRFAKRFQGVPNPRAGVPPAEPTHWREIAADSFGRARRRLTVRSLRGLLGLTTGPFAGFLFRTSRAARIHQGWHRFTPRSRVLLAGIAAMLASAAAYLFAVGSGPLAILPAASLIQLCAAVVSVILWSPFAAAESDEEDEED